MERKEISNWLLSIIGELITLNSEQINLDTAFADYGLNSKHFIHIVNQLSKKLNRQLAQTLLWSYPTIRSLTDFLCQTEDQIFLPDTASRVQLNEPIAVIGLACRFPNAPDIHAFWSLLEEGRIAISDIPADRWDWKQFYTKNSSDTGKMVTHQAAFLDKINEFDAEFYKMTPREALEMDPQQRLMLEITWEALESAGVIPSEIRGKDIGVFLGAIWNDYQNLILRDVHHINSYTGIGSSLNIIANRVSYLFGLCGPSLVIDTACSSSLVAVHLAMQSLRSGECNIALAGGVNLIINPETMIMLSKFGGLSPSGSCRTFDENADGYGRGEGAGLVVLKPLSRALIDGDKVWCVLRGSAVNNDGASNGLTAPNPFAQLNLYSNACLQSDIVPRDVEYVEAHGTGTPLGDPIEAETLYKFYCQNKDTKLLIGSVKSNIGHLEGAAGIAGLIKTILAIYYRKIPQNGNFISPNSKILFEEWGLTVPAETMDWPCASNKRPIAAISAFGWGGTNCHLIAQGFDLKIQNLDIVYQNKNANEKNVFVYSGQGSQWIKMGQLLINKEPMFYKALKNCDEIFLKYSSWSILKELIQNEEPKKWDNPAIIQPIIFSLQVAMTELLRAYGVQPSVVVGHSLGGIAAAYAAKMLDLTQAVKLVYYYSTAQQELAGKGGMLVVGLGHNSVNSYLNFTPDISIAGIIGANTCVVAGNVADLEVLERILKEKGIFTSYVAVNIAAHTHQIDMIAEKLNHNISWLVPVNSPILFLSSTKGDWILGENLTPDYWIEDLSTSVNLPLAIEVLCNEGYRKFIEVSPHCVLLEEIQKLLEHSRISDGTFVTCMKRHDEAVIYHAIQKLTGQIDYSYDKNLKETSVRQADLAKYVLLLSAHDEPALKQRVRDFAHILHNVDTNKINDVCYTANHKLEYLKYRVAFIFSEFNKGNILLDYINGVQNDHIVSSNTEMSMIDNDLFKIAWSYISDPHFDRAIISPDIGRQIAIPTYPWQKQVYWKPKTPVYPSIMAAEDPLQLSPIYSPLIENNSKVFGCRINLKMVNTLYDHVIDNKVYFPAAGFITLWCQTAPMISLKNILLIAPIELNELDINELQFILTKADNTVTVFSRNYESWVRNATFSVISQQSLNNTERLYNTLEVLKQTIKTQHDPYVFYENMSDFHLNYGERFRNLVEIYTDSDVSPTKVLAKIELRGYSVGLESIVILDAGLQCFGVFLAENEILKEKKYVIQPYSISELMINGDIEKGAWVYGQLIRFERNDSIIMEVTIYDEEGRMLFAANELILRIVPLLLPKHGAHNKIISSRADLVLINQTKELQQLVPFERKIKLKQLIAEAINQILDSNLLETNSDDKNLRELGLDSLSSIDLKNSLKQLVGQDLPATLLFSYPSLNELSDYMYELLFEHKDSSVVSDDINLSEIDRLSDDDALTSLVSKLSSLAKEEEET